MAPGKRARVPQHVIDRLMDDMSQDPRLPASNPTEAFWQLPAAALSTHQSAKLPERTTYAIIGSGITGCSVTKNLFENLPADSAATVTVLDARSLTSGATGRNGGHLVSPIPDEFLQFEEHLGTDEAVKIAKFAERTLESMHSLANGSGPEVQKAAEARRVRSISAYDDVEHFAEVKRSFQRYAEFIPAFKDDYELLTPEEGEKKYHMTSKAGIGSYSAGAFWPYRMITLLWAQMLEKYNHRLAIETGTPVSSVEYDNQSKEHPYRITTPRGTILATTVVYCTNGWTGHLLPSLRGKIFPVRGTMSCQQSGSDFSNEGDKKSWSTFGGQRYDSADGSFTWGLYYITQNAVTGDIFIGGEKEQLDKLITSDDSAIGEMPKGIVENVLPTIFTKGWKQGEKPVVKKIWSGVLGMTPDNMPLVGQLPKSATGRSGDGEWIAAGFNGYGMPLCWGCGEAVAKTLLGKKAEVDEWFPGSFWASTKRLNSPYLTREAAAAMLLNQKPGFITTARLGIRHMLGTAYRTVFG